MRRKEYVVHLFLLSCTQSVKGLQTQTFYFLIIKIISSLTSYWEGNILCKDCNREIKIILSIFLSISMQSFLLFPLVVYLGVGKLNKKHVFWFEWIAKLSSKYIWYKWFSFYFGYFLSLRWGLLHEWKRTLYPVLLRGYPSEGASVLWGKECLGYNNRKSHADSACCIWWGGYERNSEGKWDCIAHCLENFNLFPLVYTYPFLFPVLWKLNVFLLGALLFS